MIPREILKKIRQIEIRTNRLVSETLAGQYHSVFKGQGMNFDEVREYQPGARQGPKRAAGSDAGKTGHHRRPDL